MRHLLLAGLVVFAASALAQPQSLVDEFERRTIESNGVTMSYGLFVPDGYDPSIDYPLVVAFHGLGESGTTLVNLERHRLATSWADPARQAKYPAIVLAPQTLQGRRWTTDQDPDDTDPVAVQLAVLDILDLVEAEFSIDLDRVYAVGLSLGGHATWDFVSRYPERFAAAVPMSGRGFPSQADDLANMPVWAFTGETDGVVAASQTRRVIQAMEDLGRDVVYTHCRRSPVNARAFDCPGYIGADSVRAAIDAHAEVVYWSLPDVGHGPWAPWFDNGLMADWLFSKVRLDPDAITVTAPAEGDRTSGTTTVTWMTTRTTADTVEVWLNRTGQADGWQKQGEASLASGSFSLDTDALPDAVRARVRLFVRNSDGRIAGRDTSAPFAIDNAANAAPELNLDTDGLRLDPRVTTPTLDLRFTAADVEGDALSAQVFYSTDGGQTYALVAEPELADGAEQSVALDLAGLSNASTARVRLAVSDGRLTTSAETPVFEKATSRGEVRSARQLTGDGGGVVELRIIDESALADLDYELQIQEEDGVKTYDVVSFSSGSPSSVLSDVPFSDGVTESPVFDGLALVVRDFEDGRADLDETGWTVGDSDIGVTVSGGSVRISILTIDLLATETDYDLTIADGVVGQSTAIYTLPAVDVAFTVTGDGGEQREVAFQDLDGDGRPGNGDILFILEPDAAGELELAWDLRFSAGDGTILPEAGDTFRLVPIRALGSGDVFAFEGRFNTSDEDVPEGSLALRAFPNPSTGPVTIDYRLGAPAQVEVEVFDMLGRRIAMLADGPAERGSHRATWNAGASGVFIVRVTARPAGRGAAVVAHRSVTRIGR
ncbi:MAG: T9SS type A sorting domain-containing protein [Bacteroidota bacterium]